MIIDVAYFPFQLHLEPTRLLFAKDDNNIPVILDVV